MGLNVRRPDDIHAVVPTHSHQSDLAGHSDQVDRVRQGGVGPKADAPESFELEIRDLVGVRRIHGHFIKSFKVFRQAV